MSKDQYDPEIQSVIDRFIAGEVSIRTKDAKDPAKDRRNLPKKSQAGWADSHEEAVKKLEDKRQNQGNYYERLSNRGLNRKGGADESDDDL